MNNSKLVCKTDKKDILLSRIHKIRENIDGQGRKFVSCEQCGMVEIEFKQNGQIY